MPTASERIAQFAEDFNAYPVSDAQRHVVYRALLDTFAVAIAGRRDPASCIAEGYALGLGGPAQASSWISGKPISAESAAWLNGIAGHVLDYDDMLPPMRGHPSVAMLPALVALGEMAGADGRGLSLAYIAGFEVLAKISHVIGIQHNSTGWHATATLGVLGATVACAVLLKLNQRQIVHALGLAVAQSAGNRQNFGTMAKSYQVGSANAVAVRAALLARAGFDAPADALDGKYGYAALYAGNADLGSALAKLGAGTLEFDAISLDVKKFPCGYAIHRTLDGVLALRQKHGLTMDAVDTVEVVTNAHNLEPLTYTRPGTELEAKFSLEYPVAAALLDGRITLSSFSEHNVVRDEIRAFLPRITKREGPGPMLPRWAHVSMHLKDGTTVAEHVTSSRGDAQNPLSDGELIEKAQDCLEFGGCNSNAQKIAATIFGMSDVSLSQVMLAIAR